VLHRYARVHVLVIEEVGYLSYGADAANVLYHLVNDRHLANRPIIFTTNKGPAMWGDVLHDADLAEAIIDRVLERGRFITVDGPSYRTRHIDSISLPETGHRYRNWPAGVSGTHNVTGRIIAVDRSGKDGSRKDKEVCPQQCSAIRHLLDVDQVLCGICGQPWDDQGRFRVPTSIASTISDSRKRHHSPYRAYWHAVAVLCEGSF
jgi:hypothetical protein